MKVNDIRSCGGTVVLADSEEGAQTPHGTRKHWTAQLHHVRHVRLVLLGPALADSERPEGRLRGHLKDQQGREHCCWAKS